MVFHTAWAPPVPVIEKLSSMFKTLTFSLISKGESDLFSSEILIENGSIKTRKIVGEIPNPYYSEYFQVLLYRGELELRMPASPVEFEDMFKQVKH